MALVKRNNNANPLERFFSDFFENDPFSGNWLAHKTDATPRVNIKENDKDFEIELAAPGMDKNDFQLSVENDRLVICAEKQKENKEERDNYTRREFSYSSFTRSFNLPENVDENKISANYKDGVLHLSIPKTEHAAKLKRKEIKIG
jgi:HSP20 family protein